MKINVGNQIPTTSKVDNVILLAPTKFLVRSLKPKLFEFFKDVMKSKYPYIINRKSY